MSIIIIVTLQKSCSDLMVIGSFINYEEYRLEFNSHRISSLLEMTWLKRLNIHLRKKKKKKKARLYDVSMIFS